MSMVNLKRIARYQVRQERIAGDEIIDFLKSWWSVKYNRPNNDPLLLSKYVEELLIEYYEDIFRKQPEKLNEFEISIKEVHQDSDESWFKKVMGDQYTPANAYSEDFKTSKETETTKDDGFSDTYQTFGGGKTD